GLPRRVADGGDLQAVGLDAVPALAALVEPDDHVAPAVAQVLGVGVPLTAVAHHRDLLPLQQGKIRVLLVVDYRHFLHSPLGRSRACVKGVACRVFHLRPSPLVGDGDGGEGFPYATASSARTATAPLPRSSATQPVRAISLIP